MIVPLIIDSSDILSQFYISKVELENMYDNIAKSITLQYYNQLENEVAGTLKSTRMMYLQNLRLIDSGKMEGTVMLDYSQNLLIRKLEEGSPAYDMKPALMASPKAKVGKNGNRYISIPMRWSTPGAIGESEVFSSPMPVAIHKIAKRTNGPLSLSQIPSQYQTIETRPVINDNSGKKLFNEYQHKSSIYEGIFKKTDSATSQSTYMSFRRVSENSDSNAFIHPGFKRGDFMQRTLAQFDLETILQQQIDIELSKLGF